MCREDADAEFMSTVAAEIEKASPGTLTFLTGGNVPTPGWHHKPADKVFLLSGPKGKDSLCNPLCRPSECCYSSEVCPSPERRLS